MPTDLPTQENGTSHTETNGITPKNQQAVKEGLARMLKGGVIMDVVNAEQVCYPQFICHGGAFVAFT